MFRDRRVVAGLGVALVVAVAALVSPRTVLASLENLASDPLLFGVAVLALYLVRPLLAWPPVACAAVVGYGYGVAGVPVALAGAGLTALGPFLATRWVAAGEYDADAPVWLAGPTGRVREASERYFATAGGLRGMTAARLAPLPADPVTCAAAASGVSARTVVAGTLIGELPWTVAAVLVGASAGRVASAPGSVGLSLAVAAGSLAVLLLARPAYRYLRDDRSPGEGRSPDGS